MQVSNYGREYTVTTTLTSSICTYNGVTKTATDSVEVPTFANLRVSSASIGSVAGTWVVSNNAKRSESTLVAFELIPKDGVATIDFRLESTLTATIAVCTTNKSGTSITVTAWNKPWL